jgi:hypothetical protein
MAEPLAKRAKVLNRIALSGDEGLELVRPFTLCEELFGHFAAGERRPPRNLYLPPQPGPME